MAFRKMTAALAFGLLAACAQTQSTTETPAAPPGATTPDYADPVSWLCLPGRTSDACTQDQSTTVVAANGTLTPEAHRADANAPIDCFYVYPTVSTDPTPNSDMSIDDAERYVVQQQFARFGAKCRTFAPMYRQVTLAALRGVMTGQPVNVDRMMPYNDVKAAWEHYLAHHNNGRGVILIGHSQGSGVLTALIANEIEGKPVADRMIAAYLIGANVAVPRGGGLGGALKSTPRCASATDTGCLVSFVSFRTETPPPANARFGTPQSNYPPNFSPADYTAACVNPAALLRPSNGPVALNAYLAASGRAIVAGVPAPVWAKDKTVSTPFVSVPGLLSAQCVSNATHTWLAVTTNADPADPRIDAIPGDVLVGGRVLADWGLHLIDVNIAMGDLVELAGRQGEAWRARR
ncbi:MAG: DUF3089 domain-containing protein [Hyphomonadaceae bacterium]|nr:DUF3089 domain-containing protein [Hyphomonadaceae bacterium]